jgi:uncharacterized protein
MKRTNILWRLLPLLLTLAIALPSFAEKVSSLPAPTGYIDDFAAVFSDSAKSNMEGLCRELHEKTKAQVFVVTVNTTEDEPVETFANQLFAKWKIGEKKTDRGVLMLFAIRDRQRWIEVGYGFEGILNDAKVGDIGRTMVPALQVANYDHAAEIGLRQITRIIATDAGVTLDALADHTQTEPTAPAPVTGPPPSSASVKPGATLFLTILFFTFPVFIICFVIWRIATAVRKGTWTRGSSGYGTGSSFGAGDSFGSSSDSGGDSFGGGDGGSSGGGGAGGDW